MRLLLVFFIFSLSFCSSLPEKPKHPDRIVKGDYTFAIENSRYLIKKWMKDLKLAGVSYAIVDENSIIHREGLGYADKDKNINAASDSIYKIGSLSKVFTATAIMKLTEDGKLNIDAPITKYLPELKLHHRYNSKKQITIRNILTHHSGLPSDRMQNFFLPDDESYQTEYLKLTELLEGDYSVREPDKIWAYSNLGYSLLGVIISRVSGSNLEDYVREKVLLPLKMESTTYYENIDRSKLALPYHFGNLESGLHLRIRDIAAGSMYSTVDDISKFMQALFKEGKTESGKQIIKDSTLKEMLKQQNKDIVLDFDFRIGLCYFIMNKEGDIVPIYGHGGDLPPYSTIMVFSPKHKIGMVIMTASTSGSSLLSDIAVNTLRAVYEAKTGEAYKAPIFTKDTNTREKLTPDYKGFYASGMGLLEVSEDSLKMLGLNFKLIPTDTLEYGIKLKLFGFIPLSIPGLDQWRLSFQTVDGTKTLSISTPLIPRGSHLGVAEKIENVPIPSTWKDRKGKYNTQNPGTAPMIKKFKITDGDGDFLFIEFETVLVNGKISSPVKYPIKIINDREAVVFGNGRNLGDTVKVKMLDGKEIITYSGYDFSK